MKVGFLGTEASYPPEVIMPQIVVTFDGTVALFDKIAPTQPIAQDQFVLPTDLATPVRGAAETVAFVENAKQADRPIVRMFRRFLINHVVEQTGRSEADVKEAVAKVETTSGRPILDWLENGGLQTLIKLILQILSIAAVAA